MKESNVDIKIVSILTILIITFVCFGAMAADNKIPRISIDKLKAMIDEGQGIIILDTQPKIVYNMEHIKGAISFPWEMKIDPEKAKSLPRNKTIVTYCDCGPGEADSSDVAAQLKKMGFENVLVLADPSVHGWIEKGYPKE